MFRDLGEEMLNILSQNVLNFYDFFFFFQKKNSNFFFKYREAIQRLEKIPGKLPRKEAIWKLISG